MKYQDSVFNQLLKALPGYQLERLIGKHQGDYRIRTLGCREQLLALLYAQLTKRKSLRDLEVSFNAHRRHFYHLGCRGEIKRSTLADANNTRPVALFEELFSRLAVEGLSGKKKREATRWVRLLDSTTVQLSKARFGWAVAHKGVSGIKIHTVYDLDAEVPTYFEVTPSRHSDLSTAKRFTFEPGRHYVFDRGYYDFSFWKRLDEQGCQFVTRLKKHSPTHLQRVRPLPDQAGLILSDHEVTLSRRMARSRINPYSKRLREITVQLEDKPMPIRIVTNDFDSEATAIAELYKKRWQIELFFKWIKQNLKIKTFLGTSENAVKIQVLVAMIAYILLRILHNRLPIPDAPFLVLTRLVETNLMRRIGLIEILAPPPLHRPPTEQMRPQQCFAFS